MGFGGQDGHQRAREEQARSGRRGRDWVDERTGDRRHNSNGKYKSTDRDRPHNHLKHDDQPRPRDLDKW